jgi:hypothetical protein
MNFDDIGLKIYLSYHKLGKIIYYEMKRMSGKMRNTKLFMILMTLLPWLSVPLLNAKTFNRFLPSTLFMCLYFAAEGYLAQKKNGGGFHYL